MSRGRRSVTPFSSALRASASTMLSVKGCYGTAALRELRAVSCELWAVSYGL